MTSKEQPVCQIFSFQDCKASPDPIYELPAQCLTATSVPIVIDNGSFQTRAGWATPAAEDDSPRLLFRSVAARSRGAARSETQIGNDIPNLEPLRWLLKSQFDRNVVVNFEIQELIFDYVFTHLGIASEVSDGGWRCDKNGITQEMRVYAFSLISNENAKNLFELQFSYFILCKCFSIRVGNVCFL